MFDNMFSGVMGKIQKGCCRLSMNGKIAIKTSDGYKVYNEKTGSLTNCSNFVLDIVDDMFMLIPTMALKPGDIVLINGKPMYILETKAKNRVEAMDYETSTIQTVIPERHAIMGRKFYGKIVSLIGSGFCGKGGFFKNMLKFKMMSTIMGGDTTGNNSFGNALPMMMLMGNGSMDGLFDGFCDDDDEDCNIFDGFQVEDDESKDDDEDVIIKKKPAKKATKKAVKKGR
jgi:hypothetical protein